MSDNTELGHWQVGDCKNIARYRTPRYFVSAAERHTRAGSGRCQSTSYWLADTQYRRGGIVGKLGDWIAKQDPWASDALRRAALAISATIEDAEAIALRVQAAHGISIDANLECIAFDEAILTAPGDAGEMGLLTSIGPLDHVDRLAEGQELKFALNGLTIIFGENGSGKSGYARAARRLCTSRVPFALQGNVYRESVGAPTVNFSVKVGEAEPVPHRWVEGTAPPGACMHMTFLDTANARLYVEDKTEILFLPPEVRCLTRLGELYTLAAAQTQAAADALTAAHSNAVGGQSERTTEAGRIVSLLTTATALADLPSEAAIRAAGAWDAAAADQLADTRLKLAQGPAAQARTVRRLGESAKTVAEKGIAAIPLLGRGGIDIDVALVRARTDARAAADAFAREQAGKFPIAATGSESWLQLFRLARQFAAEADIVPADGAFETGDPCLLCQRPLDDEARDRMQAFDAYIDAEAAAAVVVAENAIARRIATLRALDLPTRDQVVQALAEHAAYDEDFRAIVDGAASGFGALNAHRQRRIDHLAGGAVVNDLPSIADVMKLSRTAGQYITRAEVLEQEGGIDPALTALEAELRDREALAGAIEMMTARRNGLADRQRYIAAVAALNTRPISRLATALRGELVTPDLSKRIVQEISRLGLDHVPLRFTDQSASGKSFFELALDSAGPAKKQTVLSEGEQRALAIACFLADPHVSESKGAIIVDDPVTSLDHQRIRRVANRFADVAASGRQVVIFTHNLLFYQEVIRACADREAQVPVLPCLIQQAENGFGLVSVDDQPWIAKKVRERERSLEQALKAIPNDLVPDSEDLRMLAKQFYTDLRETWERAVEEVVLGGVVERFGTDVKTLSLKMVDFDDTDYRTVFFAMKRASERSGHDQAAAKQIDAPDKKRMEADLNELREFIATQRKKAEAASKRRKEMEQPPKAIMA